MEDAELRAALADDLAGLARLHAAPLDAALLDALVGVGFPDNLALLPDEPLRQAMRAALAGVQKNWPHAAADALAADFAGIYLTGACGASPHESVWLSEEHLTCQLPMFELRALYRQAGLAVDDWRQRQDDHFVLQFQYLAQRLRDPAATWSVLGDFLDSHVGHWFGDFAAAVLRRADSDFYRALAALTADWLERFRRLLERLSGQPRVAREQMQLRIKKKMAIAAGTLAPLRFMPGGLPGAGPSW